MKSIIAWFGAVVALGFTTVMVLNLYEPPLPVWLTAFAVLGYWSAKLEPYFDNLFSEKSDKE